MTAHDSLFEEAVRTHLEVCSKVTYPTIEALRSDQLSAQDASTEENTTNARKQQEVGPIDVAQLRPISEKDKSPIGGDELMCPNGKKKLTPSIEKEKNVIEGLGHLVKS